MNFRHRSREEPEINLIPFIDVLLVVLIFLMLSTTYSKFTELQVKLPEANADAQRDHPKEIIVAVSADGRYAVNKTVVEGRTLEALTQVLAQVQTQVQGATAKNGGKDTVLIISADASAAHQSVITLMEAARRAGLSQITFATQSALSGSR